MKNSFFTVPKNVVDVYNIFTFFTLNNVLKTLEIMIINIFILF